MDDLYDDLTNYEDVNAVEELRTENKELKEMLANHTVSMEKLQKEYNTIEAEFKKLELNYSSLLMTARSEIKRKTERINQLNTEKDLMVLNALKSGVRFRRNFNKGDMKYENAPGRRNNNKEDNVKQKNFDIKKERREAPVMPPKIAVPEPSSSDRNKSDNAVVKAEICSTSKNSVNENIAQSKTDLNELPKTSARSIKDRRKSMPAMRMPVDTFSSDDELDRSSQAKDTRTDHKQSDDEKRNTNKMPIDRNTNKTSETSSVDDRVHNYHDSTSRDKYKGKSSRYPDGKSSRYPDSNSNRGWDKNGVSLKYGKPYSPERGQKRQYRERHDDYHRYERERYKGRHPESPPRESYRPRKSDHRSEYDRNSHDHEKNKYYHDDKYSSSKYRSKDNDEPHAKRLRTESHGNPDGYSKEDKRRYHDREHVDGQPAPSFSPHEYDMHRSSCQSPDIIHTDASLAHPIKEILATAATSLEDPRKTSKRYVIWKENGKERLSSAVGMNIDIRPVNKAVWNIKPMDIPVALVHRPSQCNDQLVKDIYMDIGNLDFSIESGEVRETDEEIHEYRSKPKEIQNNTQDFKSNKQVTKDISKQAPDVLKIPLTTNIAKYRIPKLGLNKTDTHSKVDVPIIDIDENVPHHKIVYRKTAEDSSPKELLTHKQQYNEERANIEDSLPNKNKYGQIEHIKRTRSKEAENSRKELSTHTQQYYEREERVNVKDSLPNIKNYSKIEGNRKSRSRERLDKLSTHTQQYDEREERMNVRDSLSNNKKDSKIEDNRKSRSRERENSYRKDLSTNKQQYDEREERMNVRDSLSNNKKDSKIEDNRKSRSRERENSYRKDLSTNKQQYDEREERMNVRDSLSNNKKNSKIEDNRKSRSRERENSYRKDLSTNKQQYDEREEHNMNVRDSLSNNKKDSKIEDNRKSRSRERENSYRKDLSTNKQQYYEREERVKGKDFLPDNQKYSKIQGRKKSRSRERENSFRKKLSTHKQKNEQEEEDSLPTSKHNSKIEVYNKSRSRERIENQHQATLTKIAIVADDLELSDDNSDLMDTNKREGPAKLQKKCETTINMNEVETYDSGNNADDKTLTSSFDTEIERTVDTAEIKDGTEEEKIKVSDGAKKQKSKKKKSKAKEISKDLVEITADDIHVPEKKPRLKKEKESTPHETKEKFSDLFGDSSSLMTPEDLGIPSYLPISEDTQDAVDIKINQIIDATPLTDKYEVSRAKQTQNSVEVNKIQKTKAHDRHDDIPKAVLQKSSTDIDDKEVITASKSNDENSEEPSQLPSPIVYENLNPETDLNDPNVVKTVIISTGIQPEIAYENKVEVTKPSAAVEVNSMQNTKDTLFPATKEYKIDLLEALATSTPQKEFSAVNPLLPEAAKTDIICDPCVSKAVATITNVEKVVNQTETNTLETNDAPDVRIFVKRRRKFVKRPPMT